MMAAPTARLRATLIRIARALLALLLLVLLSSVARFHWFPQLALVALAALAAVRPPEALLVIAALTPVAMYTGRRWDWTIQWPETLVVAFAFGWAVHRLVRPGRGPTPHALARPAVLFAVVVAAAVLVDLTVLEMRLDAAGLGRALWDHVTGSFFVNSRSFVALHTGALLLEGLLLFAAAAAAAAADPSFRRRAAKMLVLGASTAAAINVLRLFEAAMRTDAPLAALRSLVMTQRINVHHGDPNAAGSHFAMMFFVAMALAAATPARRLAWTGTAVVLTVGLWISGSRAALLCAIAAAAIVAAVRYGASWRRSTAIWLAASALVAAGTLAVAYAPMRGNQRGLSDALQSRTGLAMTSVRMLRENPVFGIGLGQFYEKSGEFSSAELLRLFPAAVHENAHNNFLQIMAEQGLLGLTAFLWTVAAALVFVFRPLTRDRADHLAWGCAGGLLAFLLSCLAGHPLLIAAPAYAFWILLGIASGVPDAPASGTVRTRRVAIAAAVLVVLVLVSIVPRAHAERDRANLEHVGIGVSGWHMSEDGVRYRWAEGEASVFVPGYVTGFLVRLRAEVEPVDVELRLDGRPGNIVRVERDVWTEVRTLMPRTGRPPQFRRVDLRVLAREGRSARLMIGRVEPF